MRFIRCLFIQRKESYPGEYLPELLVAVDDVLLEENPDYFENECAKELASVGDEVASQKVIDIEFDGKQVEKLLNNVPVLKGKIS